MDGSNTLKKCDALPQIFTKTGIPFIIAYDKGINFTTNLFKEFEKCLGTSTQFSTPQYAQCDGLVEMF